MKQIIISISVLSILFAYPVYAQELEEDFDFEIEFTQNVELENISDLIQVVTPLDSLEIQSEDLETTIQENSLISTSSNSTSSTDVLIEEIKTKQELENEEDVHVFIRNGEHVIFEATTKISDENILIIDTSGTEHSISSKSVLAILSQIDAEEDGFDISEIQYYESFDSLYIKCITINSLKVCDNWQFVVNGSSPFTSIDKTMLDAGDSIGLYFGSPYQIIFTDSEHVINTPIELTAQVYDYQTNIWEPRTNVTVGVTVTNPDDIWNPTELFTQLVDNDGKASFNVATSGQYMIGIKDDWYYPLYSITVSSSIHATTTATSTESKGGGSGTHKKDFDIPAAISFLKSLQEPNGSFGGSELYTDWAAIAFGAIGETNASVIKYLKSKAKIKNLLTDNERRAMSLLALGENPYDFSGINYIEAIEKEFDGIQFGEKQLVNDDIFALIVLSKTGYSSKDEIIKKTISFIVEKQNSNGSWENSSDLTSAAIQALMQFENVSRVDEAISSAKEYLIQTQELSGGWGSVYSTSWVLQAMSSVNEQWDVEGKTPQDYLISNQQEDGGVLIIDDSEQNRIWATSYVIPAILQKPWDQILKSVSKPKTTIVYATSTSGTSEDIETLTEESEINIEEEIEQVDLVDESILAFVPDVSVRKEIALTRSEPKLSENKESSVSEVSEESKNINQLATIHSIPFLQSMWAYLGGLLILCSIVVGIKYWKL